MATGRKVMVLGLGDIYWHCHSLERAGDSRRQFAQRAGVCQFGMDCAKVGVFSGCDERDSGNDCLCRHWCAAGKPHVSCIKTN